MAGRGIMVGGHRDCAVPADHPRWSRPSQLIASVRWTWEMRARTAGPRAIAVLILMPTLLSAEVMDKEPTLPQLWAVAILWGLAGFFAWRRHPVLGTLVTLLGFPLVWGFHWELTDRYVGPEIRREAGQAYVVQAYLSMGLCFALHLLGALRQLTRIRRLSRSTEDNAG